MNYIYNKSKFHSLNINLNIHGRTGFYELNLIHNYRLLLKTIKLLTHISNLITSL